MLPSSGNLGMWMAMIVPIKARRIAVDRQFAAKSNSPMWKVSVLSDHHFEFQVRYLNMGLD